MLLGAVDERDRVSETTLIRNAAAGPRAARWQSQPFAT